MRKIMEDSWKVRLGRFKEQRYFLSCIPHTNDAGVNRENTCYEQRHENNAWNLEIATINEKMEIWNIWHVACCRRCDVTYV